MQRKMGDEECERLKRLDATELQRKCARFVADHAAEIAKAEPQIPPGLTNRAAEIWEPLLALADLAGGQWPALAREAAVGLTTRAQEYSPIGSLLLDIFMVFILTKRDRVFSRELLAALGQGGDRPWLELRRGKQITETWLAQRLRVYGIKSRTIRIGEEVSRGYLQEDMIEPCRRYIPRSEMAALKADLAERTATQSEIQGPEEKQAEAPQPTVAQGHEGPEKPEIRNPRTEGLMEIQAQNSIAN
jgi:putative DNA primase/helicase